MHLYLSSFLLGSRLGELTSLVRSPNVLVIANALDHTAPQIRAWYLNGQIDALRQLGFDPRELDLRDYFGRGDGLPQRLEDAGLVWVTGGNVFLLRRAMRQSAFDTYIVSRKARDGLVYGGFSAGACVAGPTLRGCELVDEVNATAEGYVGDVVWDGLGLVSRCIAPHYKSDHEDAAGVDRMVNYFEEQGLPFVALRDGEVLVTTAGA
jgi:dipeptidase E